MEVDAILFDGIGKPISVRRRSIPRPQASQVLLRVNACALCRTDLHIIDGDLKHPKKPVVLGHEVVATVEKLGPNVKDIQEGDLVGVPWLASTCLNCSFCLKGNENLCESAQFTGYTVDGGFSQYTIADSRFCFKIPDNYDASHAAPLLCAGLIGWRSLKFTENSQRVGIYGFGAAAHVITPIAINQGKQIYAFTSPGDDSRQEFARSLGAVWAGSSGELAPEELDAAIIFAPVGELVPKALSATRRGGIVVCGGIHMSDIPEFPYSLLWGERTIRSVANLCRSDGREFFDFVTDVTIDTHVTEFTLTDFNEAVTEFRSGAIKGAAVIRF
jgi:propanol-preferring alcohol dehydrogenase